LIDTDKLNTEINEKWNKRWREMDLFHFDKKETARTTFIIDTPPPFTTGELHMGQAFWVSYVDSIARYKRLRGFNVLYPQGWDSQGFPTEIAVEKKYGRNISREEFYNKCAEIASNNIEFMKTQMYKMGASFDEKLQYLTMSKEYRAKVQLSLLEMMDKGFIYRAIHPVEWCPRCGTSIAREETVDFEEETSFNYVDFVISNSKKKVLIATTRPEMLGACVALAVNGGDERFKDIVGKNVKVPLFDRHVKVIADDSIDKDFGTGAEMVCTFGDKNDRTLYYRHKLELIELIDEYGKLRNAGEFTGMSATAARKAVIEKLKEGGALVKEERIKHTVKKHDRCNTSIEIRASMQWFIRVKEHAEKILQSGRSIEWIPEHTRQRLEDWVNFIEWDWNISRRRVFGTPIPFWYCEKCGEIQSPERKQLPVNPAVEKPKVEKCRKCGGKFVGEVDTCDVWVDSSITPLVICGWPDDMELFNRIFPSSMRIQGTDIIRTWAFYTIFRTWALTSNKPWGKVLAHGMILATDGKEMHKSEGNGISPEELIKKYPVDAIRLWVALSGGIGKDRPFSYEEMDYARNFINKIYNSAIFVSKAIEVCEPDKKEPHGDLGVFDLWILKRLNTTIGKVTAAYEAMNLHDAMEEAISFYWHEFADYYIENVKHRIYSEEAAMQRSRRAAVYTLKHVLHESIKLFAPVMPYISEEINGMFQKESLFGEAFPAHATVEAPADYVMNGLVFKSAIVDYDIEACGAFLNNIIADVRNAKARDRLSLNKEIASININVPEEYYRAAEAASEEIKSICKAGALKLKKHKEYSISVDTGLKKQ
jgi:valyl-tRNA synthetase